MSTLAAAHRQDMPASYLNEEEIVGAFRSGQPEAFDTVRGWVIPVAAHPGWGFADTESVVQDILFKLLDITRSGRFRKMSSFRTFATSVARHTCIDAHRRQRRRARAERLHAADKQEEAAAVSPHSRAVERRELLRYIFQRLPEECRRLWTLIHGDGMAARQVAERLEISEVNVRVRAHRCLRRAREIARDFLAQEV